MPVGRTVIVKQALGHVQHFALLDTERPQLRQHVLEIAIRRLVGADILGRKDRVELDPELVKKCKETAKSEGVADKVEFRLGDVLKVKDMADANVVLLYMGDDINNRLKPILQSTLKPGARVVSHRFTMGEWKPDRTETVNSSAGYECLIHLWTIKKKE